MPSNNFPAPPNLVIVTTDDDVIFPAEVTPGTPVSPSSPMSAGLSPISGRRPSDAPTLAPTVAGSVVAPSSSHRTLHPSIDDTASRSRSSSVGEESCMSGSTMRPETAIAYIGPKDMNRKLELGSSEDALRPDPGNEKEFEVADNKFGFSPGQLNKFLNPKSLAAYKAVGGIRGLERGLQTDTAAGLSIDEGLLPGYVSFDEAVGQKKAESVNHGAVTGGEAATAQPGSFVDRTRVFGRNTLPQKKAKSVFRLMWEQYQDKILLLLTVAAVISLAIGLYETFGVTRSPGDPPSVDWVEGVAICVAIFIVVIVGSVNDWQKERQFVKLNAKKEDRVVKAVRSGKSIQISVHDILVGDVLHLEPGDMIPADGIFISGHNLKCDESSATGESDQMKKTAGDEAYRQIEIGNATAKLDPFLISGSKVLEGVGTYLVTSVGENSSFGRLMMSLSEDAQSTPLQVKLAGMADAIAYLGGGASLLLFIVLFIRFLVQLPGSNATPPQKGENFMDIVIVCVTLIVVAVPEGLPLAVTLALAFATTRMLKQNNLVRVLRACETMGNATTICSDKTGTLTQNKMTVVAGTVGLETKFDSKGTDAESASTVVGWFSDAVKEVILHSVVLNSTAFEGEEDGKPTYIGSKTETAMLTFARDHLGMQSVSVERDNAKVVQMIPFDSARKCMGVVVKLPDGHYRLYVKGASEVLLTHATRRVSDISTGELKQVELAEEEIAHLESTINHYAENSLRTIALLYKEYSQWPPIGAKVLEEDPEQADFEDVFNEMTFLGLVGIQDPLREGVSEAVKQCQDAGIVVRMVTGDNAITARSIAMECGIFDPSTSEIMEGPEFRRLSDQEMDEMLPRLRVLARSSPEDKRILVKRLKELGETVAVTGDGTNDGPALKMADVGFSMGIAGTEVAKEASAIILMDDNFSSIITAIMWGRSVNDAVRKFLQFQLTVNITAVLLAFVSACSNSDNASVLTAVQLLWVNLIMDTFAALALATDAPTKKILDRKPTPKSAPLVSLNMWKMIIGQAIFQLIATYILYFAGERIYPSYSATTRNTIVFNTFVWMQIFNEFNNRRLDNKFNIFEGMFKNWFFMGINVIMIGGQVMIIFIGGRAFSITRLNGDQWAICIVIALLCLPWGVLIRCIPDESVAAAWNGVVKVFGPSVCSVRRVFVRMWRAIPGVKKAPVAEGNDVSMDEETGTRASKEVSG